MEEPPTDASPGRAHAVPQDRERRRDREQRDAPGESADDWVLQRPGGVRGHRGWVPEKRAE
jgi:hypothetical protein